MVRFSRLLWQSFGGSVAPCRRDLNSTCWLMLLRMCENFSWRRDNSWTLLPAWALEQSTRRSFTLAGSQHFDTRRTWNDELRCTLYERIYCYKQLLKKRVSVRIRLHDTRLWVSWRESSSTQHVAGGSSSAVRLSSSATRLPSSSTRKAGSTAAARLPPSVRRRLFFAILRLPPRITDQLQDSRMLCFFAVALLCFSSIS